MKREAAEHFERLRALAASYGASVALEIGGKHYKARVSCADGRAFFVVFAKTPSDARARANNLGDMRREFRARGIDTK